MKELVSNDAKTEKLKRDKKHSKGRAIMMLVVQFFANLIPSAIILGAVGKNSFQAVVIGALGLTISFLILLVGSISFGLETVHGSNLYAMMSVGVGSALSSLAVGSIPVLNGFCSINQIAYKNCNNFTETYCAIENTCGVDSLSASGSGCEAFPTDLCQHTSRASSILASGAFFLFFFNVLAGWTGSTFSQIADSCNHLARASKTTAVDPVENSTTSTIDILKRLSQLEEMTTAHNKRLDKQGISSPSTDSKPNEGQIATTRSQSPKRRRRKASPERGAKETPKKEQKCDSVLEKEGTQIEATESLETPGVEAISGKPLPAVLEEEAQPATQKELQKDLVSQPSMKQFDPDLMSVAESDL